MLKTLWNVVLPLLFAALMLWLALDFKWEPYGSYVVGAMLGVGAILMPLGFLPTKAKRVYFPISILLVAIGIPVVMYFGTECGYVLLAILLAVSLLNAALFLMHVWVCPHCGALVGWEDGSARTHNCVDRS
jgi:hypothetical protein